mgnify:CR=1 FL=1
MSKRTVVLVLVLSLFVPVALVGAQPSPRGYVDMVYVPQVEKVLLVAGQADYNPPYEAVGGTWWYDPADDSWSQVLTDPAAPARSGANLALHTPTGTAVFVGGSVPRGGGFASVDETWLFDPVTEQWTQLTFEAGAFPPSHPGEMIAYHEASDTLVLYGGFDLNRGDFVDATWHFDLASETWTRVEPAVVPPGRNYNAFAYDPRTERLVMSGGPYAPGGPDEVWTYDPRELTWQEHERVPPGNLTDYARMVFDPTSGELIRFGGVGSQPGPGAWSVSADLTWTLLEPAGDRPPTISRHAMAAVPGLGVLVFGGVPSGFSDFTNDLWLLDTTGDPRWERR